MRSRIPSALLPVRRDLSQWAWHFCNRDGEPLAALQAILSSGHIRGGTDRYCPEPAVCFTETPITELIRQSPTLEGFRYTRLSDYGIGFKKEWLFTKGGLPVIYQPASMLGDLPPGMRWRHCELDYRKGIDFTWQREWRVPGDRVEFSSQDDLIVVLRTEEEAMRTVYSGIYFDDRHDEVFVDVGWSYVTHEILAAASGPHEIETLRVPRDA